MNHTVRMLNLVQLIWKSEITAKHMDHIKYLYELHAYDVPDEQMHLQTLICNPYNSSLTILDPCTPELHTTRIPACNVTQSRESDWLRLWLLSTLLIAWYVFSTTIFFLSWFPYIEDNAWFRLGGSRIIVGLMKMMMLYLYFRWLHFFNF
jgi:hypothetical protein